MQIEDYKENYYPGWIKIFRSIRKHWIWDDPIKLKWWIDILLEVNHESKTIAIGYKLFECDRGECLMSLKNWSHRWNVSKTVVNNFLKLLEKDNMISIKNETVTTRITVCNYEDYQKTENANKTEQKRNKNGIKTQKSTTKELKNENNLNKEVFSFKKSLLGLGVENQVVSDWLAVRRKKKASNTETAFNGIKSQIEKSGLSANECIKIAVERSWQGFNYKWLDDEKNRAINNKGFKSDSSQQAAKSIIKSLLD